MEENIENPVTVKVNDVSLEGILIVPENAKGIVIFAHGAGSGRHSPRNKFVASALYKDLIGSLLFDLLTKDEDTIYENRFNIPLLTSRLISVTKWCKEQESKKNLPFGYYGASTGAAAVLQAASNLDLNVKACVSRGGRVDLAKEYLKLIKAPTLFIVGEMDDVVLKMNKVAYKYLQCTKELVVIPQAGHLFEEPGAIEKVSEVTTDWFVKYLTLNY